MPSSITFVLLAALIVSLAANGMMWKNRLAGSAEIDSLTTQLSQISDNVSHITPPPADLQARLATAQAGLVKAQAAYPARFNRNEALDYIINLARQCGVEVLPLNSEGWAEGTAGQSSALKLNGTITGTFAQATDFISKLQDGKYATLIMPELDFTRTSPAIAFAASANVSVRFRAEIYTQGNTQ